jgi:hypothetical protein
VAQAVDIWPKMAFDTGKSTRRKLRVLKSERTQLTPIGDLGTQVIDLLQDHVTLVIFWLGHDRRLFLEGTRTLNGTADHDSAILPNK